MALHHGTNHPVKSVGEHGVCFGLTLAVLTAAAFGLQWLMHLL